MNKRLRFSWGHILAFIALIAASYTSFVGFTYLSNGSFLSGAFGMVMTDLVFIFVFIGAQQLKASGENMKNKIVWERILVFGSPLIFVAGMISISHFWTVQSRNDEVVKTFNGALTNGKSIFEDYESYANARIEKYNSTLSTIVAGKKSNPTMFKQAGFTDGKEAMQKENMVEVLRLQLLPANYDSLKNLAIVWIDKANKGANTANVFLLGNTREIREAFLNWEKVLNDMASKKLSNEALLGTVPDFTSQAGTQAAAQLDGMSESFTKQKIPTIWAIVFGIILYALLIFPYLIQPRHSKSVYSLGSTGGQNFKSHKKHPQHSQPMPMNPMQNPMHPGQPNGGNYVQRPFDDEGDFPSF